MDAFAQMLAIGLQLNLDLRRFALEEDLRSIRHFNGKVLQVELLDGEGRGGGFLLFAHENAFFVNG